MGRMYGNGKGIAKSCMPYKKRAPRWLNIDSTEIIKQIEALAKKGYKPSQIGLILRDNFAIPQSSLITGGKILRVLRKKNLVGSLCPGIVITLHTFSGIHHPVTVLRNWTQKSLNSPQP